MQRDISCLTPVPRSLHVNGAGFDSIRQLQAVLLLNHRPVLEIENDDTVQNASRLKLQFVPQTETRSEGSIQRVPDVPPPSHWGINE